MSMALPPLLPLELLAPLALLLLAAAAPARGERKNGPR